MFSLRLSAWCFRGAKIDRPPRARRRELATEAREGAEEFRYGRREIPVRLSGAPRAQVLPQERVQDVPGQVERQVLLQLIEGGEVFLRPFRPLWTDVARFLVSDAP